MRKMITNKQIEEIGKLKYMEVIPNPDDLTTINFGSIEGDESYLYLKGSSINIGDLYDANYLYIGNSNEGDGIELYSDITVDINSLQNVSLTGTKKIVLTSSEINLNGHQTDQYSYGSVILMSTNENEDKIGAIYVNINGITLDADKDSTANGLLILKHIPTSDPHEVGAVWNDNGVLKISSGS